MDGLFNNREIAAAVWLVILFAVGIFWKVTRKGAIGMLRAFFTPKILVPLLVSFLPAVLVVLVLAQLEWWDLSVLKETIYWFVGTGLVMFVSFDKVIGMKTLFKRTLKDVLALTIIIEFFVGFYVFPLWIELLLLPFTTFLLMLSAVAKYQKTNSTELTRKFLNGLVIFVGFVVLLFATIEFVHDPKPLLTFENLELFLLPIALSFAYIPSVYFIALYSKYDLAFNRINYLMNKNIKRKSSLKLACVKQCGLSVREAGELVFHLTVGLTSKTTKDQALMLIREFKAQDPKHNGQ